LIITLYNILTTRVGSLAKLYNHWAVLALDIFGVIFWLSTMGALAALRAIFVIPTTINGCGHTGSLGGGYCYKAKRELEKRQGYVATHGYLNTISVSAGFSAINLYVPLLRLPTKNPKSNMSQHPLRGNPRLHQHCHPPNPQGRHWRY
jgi:hypothetical protein